MDADIRVSFNAYLFYIFAFSWHNLARNVPTRSCFDREANLPILPRQENSAKILNTGNNTEKTCVCRNYGHWGLLILSKSDISVWLESIFKNSQITQHYPDISSLHVHILLNCLLSSQQLLLQHCACLL